jgi:hypothetical protein
MDSDRYDATRHEAERLAAAALAAASFATKNLSRRMAKRARASAPRPPEPRGFGDELAALAGLASRFLGDDRSSARDERRPAPADDRRGHHVANGSEECCVCPVCRMISAVRDPSPEFSERIASGASDLAAGFASVLRAFGNARPPGFGGGSGPARDSATVVDEPLITEETVTADAPPVGLRDEPATEPDAPVSWGNNFGSVWQAATRAPFDDSRPAAPAPQSKPMAKKSVAKSVRSAEPEPSTHPAQPPAKKTAAKKTAAKKTAPAEPQSAAHPEPVKKAVAKKTAANKATAKKTTASKAAAKKATETTPVAKKAPAKKAGAKNAQSNPVTPPAATDPSE